MKKILLLVLGVALLCLARSSGSASAQAAVDGAAGTLTYPSYTYKTLPTNNLTLLARRSVQLVDDANTDIKLTPEQAVYAETNIVQKIGAKELDINDQVFVDEKIVTEYVNSSQKLTQTQLSAWTPYLAGADLSTPQVQLLSGVTTPKQSSTTDTKSPTVSTDTKNITTANNENKKAPWYWWLIGAGTLGGLYYLLGGKKPSDETDQE
jgi:hypothetical protein